MLKHESPSFQRVSAVTCWLVLLLLASTATIEASQLSIVNPVNTWVDTITGPIAFSLGLLVLVGVGLALAFGRVDVQQFAITGAVTILLLAIVFFARPTIRELFGGSSTPAAALLGF